MRLVLVSDTHTYHNNVVLPEGDILIHCGDSTMYGEVWEVKNLLNWFNRLNFEKIIFINGNHEVMVSKLGNITRELVKESCDNNVTYLENEFYTYKGINFYGSPNTPEFYDWAYMYDREHAHRVWAGIPNNTDVLITHGPPFGVLDGVTPIARYQGNHAGCEGLMSRVMDVNPKLHCFGHIHNHYGWLKKANPNCQTLFVNASTCNDRYIPINPPIVVDTDGWTAI